MLKHVQSVFTLFLSNPINTPSLTTTYSLLILLFHFLAVTQLINDVTVL